MPQECTTNKVQDFPNVFFANLQPSGVNVYILQTSVFISFNSFMLHSTLCLPTFMTYRCRYILFYVYYDYTNAKQNTSNNDCGS